MMGVTKRVSIPISLGLIVGWGVLAILVLQSRITTAGADSLDHPASVMTSSVRLKFQIDKEVYRAGDTVLLALRNDSRKPIWLTEHADGCSDSWWQVQQLQSDGETWMAVPLSKETCSTTHFGQETFTRHTIKTAQWNTQVPGPQLGNVVMNAPSGTYRFAAKYLAMTKAPSEGDWQVENAPTVVSSVFTIQ